MSVIFYQSNLIVDGERMLFNHMSQLRKIDSGGQRCRTSQYFIFQRNYHCQQPGVHFLNINQVANINLPGLLK